MIYIVTVVIDGEIREQDVYNDSRTACACLIAQIRKYAIETNMGMATFMKLEEKIRSDCWYGLKDTNFISYKMPRARFYFKEVSL